MQIEVVPITKMMSEEELRRFPKIIEAFYGEPLGDETVEECREIVKKQKALFYEVCRKEGIDFPEWREEAGNTRGEASHLSRGEGGGETRKRKETENGRTKNSYEKNTGRM